MNSFELTKHLFQNGHLSKEAAGRILQTRKEIIKEALEDFTASYFGFNKEAASRWGEKSLDAAKTMLPMLGIAGLAAVGTTAAKVGLNALSDMRVRKQIEASFEGMFDEYPDLAENKPQAAKFFNMMSTYAPSLATNPIIAGTWVKSMMNQNVVDPQNIKHLIDAQSAWEDIRTMRSPLLGMSQEYPGAKEILQGSMKMYAGADDD